MRVHSQFVLFCQFCFFFLVQVLLLDLRIDQRSRIDGCGKKLKMNIVNDYQDLIIHAKVGFLV